MRPSLGKAPKGNRLARILASPHYRNGAFQNIHDTPSLKEGYSFVKVLYEYLFKKPKHLRPAEDIPAVKTKLTDLPVNEDVLVWFGHSSYYMQLAGKRWLIDPVFSDNASPIPGSNRPFKGSTAYSASDMPEIDYLLISHDHYDHLDYETIKALTPKIKKVITGLGVGEHFEYWGYAPEIIVEMDWGDEMHLGDKMTLFATPARHFSGRSFKRNNTLWLSFVLDTEYFKLFIGGDGGYDTHFKEIGEKFGPFDLAILENGQYNLAWHYIHMLPEEVYQAAEDLNAKRLLPVHSSKFALAFHPWKEPLTKLSALSQMKSIPLLTPMIGELVQLNDANQLFMPWWEKVDLKD